MFDTNVNAIINNLFNNIFNAIWFYVLIVTPRFNRTKTIVITIVFAVFAEFIALTALLWYGSDKVVYTALYIVASLTYIAYYIFIIQKENPLKALFIFFSYVCMWASIYVLSMMITNHMLEGKEYYVWILRTAFNIALLPVYQRLIKSRFIKSQRILAKPSFILLLVSGMINLLLPLLIYFFVYYEAATLFKLPIVVFFLLFSIIVYILIIRFIKQTTKENKVRAIEAQNKLLIEALKNAEEIEKQTSRMRHDSRHQAELLLGFAQEGNTDAIIKHLQGQRLREEEADSVRYCGNNTVDMILRSYIRKAKANNIEVTTDIRMNEETTIADEDLIAILGNMLENAINGCLKLPDNRKMEISVYNKSIKLVMLCKNTCEADICFDNGIPKRKTGGGIGVTSIRMSADRYNGEVVFTAEKGSFTCGVILNDYK